MVKMEKKKKKMQHSCISAHLTLLISSVERNLPANAEDTREAGLIPGWGRSSREGNGNPLQYSCLENPMDRGAQRAAVHGSQKDWTWLRKWQQPVLIMDTLTPGWVTAHWCWGSLEGLPLPRLGQSKIEMGVTMPQGSSPSGGYFHQQTAPDQLARIGKSWGQNSWGQQHCGCISVTVV